MMTFRRIFKFRQDALDTYASQVSKGRLYVESFEALPRNTDVSVTLLMGATGETVTLTGKVERMVGKSEAVRENYGQRSGVLLIIDASDPALCKFFDVKPPSAQTTDQPSPVPFENLSQRDADDIEKEVDAYLELSRNGSLYQLFGFKDKLDKDTLRDVYRAMVKSLHPDKHQTNLTQSISDKLADAYQIVNDAYKILQNAITNKIYLDISRDNLKPKGMSLTSYKKFLADYRLKNSNNIKMANDLTQRAQEAISDGKKDAVAQNLKLALQYDKYNEMARSMLSTLSL